MLCPMFSTIFPQNFLLPRPQAARRPLPCAAVCGRGQRRHTRLAPLAAWAGCEARQEGAEQGRAGEAGRDPQIRFPLLRAPLCSPLPAARLHLNATSSLCRVCTGSFACPVFLVVCTALIHRSQSRAPLLSTRLSASSASLVRPPPPPWRLDGDGRATRCSTIPCACSHERPNEDRQW